MQLVSHPYLWSRRAAPACATGWPGCCPDREPACVAIPVPSSGRTPRGGNSPVQGEEPDHRPILGRQAYIQNSILSENTPYSDAGNPSGCSRSRAARPERPEPRRMSSTYLRIRSGPDEPPGTTINSSSSLRLSTRPGEASGRVRPTTRSSRAYFARRMFRSSHGCTRRPPTGRPRAAQRETWADR